MLNDEVVGASVFGVIVCQAMARTHVRNPVSEANHPANYEVKRRGLKDYLMVGIKGFCMGTADVVPGVSGGTIALIVGIYEELIQSIKMLGRPAFLRPLLRLRISEAFRAANGWFLLSVALGILLAIVTLARGLEWLIEHQPVLLWSFFFGLILASVFVVSRRITRWLPANVTAFILGTVLAFTLVGLTPAQTPETYWFLFLSGALAVCALILPGISGAFILLLLGKYEFVLAAVSRGDIPVLLTVILGGLLGLVSFAQILGWLFRRYYNLTLALLCGFMLGSLRKIWPWKAPTDGLEPSEFSVNVLPPLMVNGGINPEVLWAVALAALGCGLVLLLERFDVTHT